MPLSRNLGKTLRKLSLGYSFLLPAIILYTVFVLWPLANTIYLSLTSWDGAKPVKEFVGLANYAKILGDARALESLSHNLGWIIVGTALPVIGGLILAVLLAGAIRGRIIFRTAYFMPAVMSMVVVGIIWGWIYNPLFGILNAILKSIGLGFLSRGWLADPKTAQWSTIATGAWTWFGVCTTIFLAGLQNVDQELYDAAKIDGANAWQRFIHVTIPQLSHVITMVSTITLIGGFKVFDIVFVMTKGGPGTRTEVIATYIYRTAFRFHEFGYASALAVLLLALVLVTTYIYIRLRERGEV